MSNGPILFSPRGESSYHFADRMRTIFQVTIRRHLIARIKSQASNLLEGGSHWVEILPERIFEALEGVTDDQVFLCRTRQTEMERNITTLKRDKPAIWTLTLIERELKLCERKNGIEISFLDEGRLDQELQAILREVVEKMNKS
ncbi:MAG: hypothetical protein Q7S34_02240 [bacterium]|nr:hypothetical protein [bacterium]